MNNQSVPGKRINKKAPQNNLPTLVNFLAELEMLSRKYHGQHKKLDRVLQECMSKTGSLVKEQVTTKRSLWDVIFGSQ